MQMFSVENYTMDRAERCTQRKEPYGRYLQEADAVRRTVPVSDTWRIPIPHNDYRREGWLSHTASSLPFGERTEEFPRADESPTLTRENSISLKVSIVQYDLFF